MPTKTTTKKKDLRGVILVNHNLSFDPDELNLTKKDLIQFCDNCIGEWKKDLRHNLRYIFAMEIMKSQIVITPEVVLKMIWGKIIEWFYKLNWENAKKDPNDEFFKFCRDKGLTKGLKKND